MDLMGQAFAIYGVAIVIALVVAAVIRGIVLVLSQAGGAAEPLEDPAARQPPSALGPPPGHVVAITAAVAALLGPAARVVHIEDSGSGRVWSAEGKFLHQTSHQFPRRGR